MAKTKVSDWDTTAANNTDVGNVAITGASSVRLGNDAIQEMMAQIAKVDDGTDAVSDTWSFGDPSDATKRVRLDAGNVTAGQTRVLTAPDRNIEVSGVPRGHLYGLTLSNNATDATNDIDIAAGEAASSDTTPSLMVLASALTKRLDASWAVGSGNGGLDTGSVSTGWYFVWLIRRSDTGVVDVLFSTSASSPTMPTNYDQKRRIGAIRRSGSASNVGFTQRGDLFLLGIPQLDVDSTTVGTSGSLFTLTVPPSIQVEALVGGHGYHISGFGIAVTSPSQDNPTVSATGVSDSSGNANTFAPVQKAVLTDTSGRIRVTGSTTLSNVRLTTFGWYDRRSRT